MGKNVCSACEIVFGSLGAFDMHRVGSYGEPIYEDSSTGKSRTVVGYMKPARRCLTLEEIKALDMKQNDRGWWITGEFDAAAKSRMQSDEEDGQEREE